MKRRDLVGTFAALVMFLTACGDPGTGASIVSAPQAPSSWGECPPDFMWEAAERNILTVPEFGWVYLSNVDASEAVDAGQENSLGDLLVSTQAATALTEEKPPAEISLHYSVVEQTKEALALGADVMVAYFISEPRSAMTGVFALLPKSDEAVLLQVCSVGQMSQTRELAAASDAASLVDFVIAAADPASPERALLINGETAAATTIASTQPLTWFELEPGIRSLDPSEAPSEIVEQLSWTRLLVLFPNSWRNVDGRICARMELGWAGTCVETSLDVEMAILTLAYQPDSPAEIWLTAPSTEADPWTALVQLARLDPNVLADIPSDGGVLLTLQGDPGSVSEVESLIGAAAVTTKVVSGLEAEALIEQFTPNPVPATGP